MQRQYHKILPAIVGIYFMSLFMGCSALFQKKYTWHERLDMLPNSLAGLSKPVAIHWNPYQVPYINAATDEDLFRAIGMVHAHLRLSQIHFYKHLSQGRLSEIVGPFAVEVDHALRILDLGRAANKIIERMPRQTRAWMEAYISGLNSYQADMQQNPPDFALYGFSREPFTLRDIVTIGRLVGTDVNWITYAALLQELDHPQWQQIWQRTLYAGAGATASFSKEEQVSRFERILRDVSKSGSNSIVIGPRKSQSDAPLVANDTHLGITAPNFWLMIGIKSPAFHAVGMMIPGLPILCFGRTPHLAWGGTNMHAAASDLYDLSQEPNMIIGSKQVRIRTRLWPDQHRVVRWSPYGPILSDAKLLKAPPGKTIALRWIGHRSSDEFTAFFSATRAKTVQEFRDSFTGYAVSSQNLLVADNQGNIGHVLAATIPQRSAKDPKHLLLVPGDESMGWQQAVDASRLPFALNPSTNFLASANNRPADTDFPIGYFFSADERIRRLKDLIRARPKWTVDNLKYLQTDVYSEIARTLNQTMVSHMLADDDLVQTSPEIVSLLEAWDGRYAHESAAPVAFEALIHYLVPAVYNRRNPDDLEAYLRNWPTLAEFFTADFEALPLQKRHDILNAALTQAREVLKRYPTWGDMHKLEVNPLPANIPVLGRLFKGASLPVSGSRETVMKTAHDLVKERHRSYYGSQCRHISDLAHPDANWFILLGGQDGWLGSENYYDQVALWRKSEYIRMPLSLEGLRTEFSKVTTIVPR